VTNINYNFISVNVPANLLRPPSALSTSQPTPQVLRKLSCCTRPPPILSEAITWTWTTSDGTLSNQVDQAGASDVDWQAPATPGETCTITATATDPEGASASAKFTVKVSG